MYVKSIAKTKKLNTILLKSSLDVTVFDLWDRFVDCDFWYQKLLQMSQDFELSDGSRTESHTLVFP